VPVLSEVVTLEQLQRNVKLPPVECREELASRMISLEAETVLDPAFRIAFKIGFPIVIEARSVPG